MDDALRKLAQSVKVIRSLHQGTGGNIPVGKPDITKSGGGDVEGHIHPAHGIPGVHIVTADAGEPVFTGAL